MLVLVLSVCRRYLARDYLGAYLLYSQAAELGYDTAQVNAAFLLDRHHVDPLALVGYSTDTEDGRQQDGGSQPMPPSEAKRWARELLSLRLRWLTYSQGGVSDAALPIGDAYYYGQAGESSQASHLHLPNASSARLKCIPTVCLGCRRLAAGLRDGGVLVLQGQRRGAHTGSVQPGPTCQARENERADGFVCFDVGCVRELVPGLHV